MAQNVIINNITYSNVPEVDIPTTGGGTAKFMDTQDATLNSASQMLNGVTAYAKSAKITGSIPTKTSSDLTASGATVSVPSGYYASTASKSVGSGSATTPATTITATPALTINDETGVVTASVSASQSITPTVSAGYVSAGTAGTVTASGSDTLELTTKSATTYTPSTSNQTIPAGTFLTGVQTIAGDADLISANIKEGVNIFGVEGSLSLVSVSQDTTTKVLSIS